MRVQLRIVSGSLRGRKITCRVGPDLRPTPQMVREALFSILGNAVPDRLFIDLFAGTGINGMEALSRGAKAAIFVERDFRLAQEIETKLAAFDVSEQGSVIRTDVYRWIGLWRPPPEPVNVFISPPFMDLQRRSDQLIAGIDSLMTKLASGSVIVVQSERQTGFNENLPNAGQWERRQYGRNELLIWIVPPAEQPAT